MTIGELQKQFLAPPLGPRLAPEDFYVLLAHATGWDKTFLLAHPEYALDVPTETKAREFFVRRLSGEPVAYITGHKEFYGLDFLVTKDTLIPRPETELLVENVLEHFKNRTPHTKNRTIIDVGTGSGNIVIALAHSLSISPQATGSTLPITFIATDISPATLKVARSNAKRHATVNISFIESDLLTSVPEEFLSGDEVIIAANLPYLSRSVFATSPPDVWSHEPKGALTDDADGLTLYRRLFREIAARRFGRPVSVFAEFSPEQATAIVDLAVRYFPRADLAVKADLAQRPRLLVLSI
jgi:release factor glutamine methyltransferase